MTIFQELREKITKLFIHSKKISVAWYWTLRNELRCFSQEPTTRCMVQLVLFLKNVPCTFFNATHQVKAIAIAVSEVNPLVEISCLLWCVYVHVFLPINSQSKYKGLSLNTNFYIALYSTFCGFIGITFNNITFLFKIDHDDGTVTGILNHLNAR